MFTVGVCVCAFVCLCVNKMSPHTISTTAEPIPFKLGDSTCTYAKSVNHVFITCITWCCHGNQVTAQSQISRQPLDRFYSNFLSARAKHVCTCAPRCSTCCSHGNRVTMVTRRQITAQNLNRIGPAVVEIFDFELLFVSWLPWLRGYQGYSTCEVLRT